MKTAKRIMLMLSITALLCCLLSVAAFAAGSGDVAGAVESTWTAASGQIKSVVNEVVFPAIDMILAIFFFVKLGTIVPPAISTPIPQNLKIFLPC